jgi:hypothetical protein
MEVATECENTNQISTNISYLTVTIYLEGLADVAAFHWLTSMVENNP